jgi:hypothetical protein
MAGKTGKAAETAVRGRPRIFAEGSVNVRIGVYDRVLRLASSERRTVRQQMELLLETALERVELETREGGAA